MGAAGILVEMSGALGAREGVQSTIAPYVLATVQPSSILRAPDEQSRHEEMQRFIEDLKPVAEQIHTRATE